MLLTVDEVLEGIGGHGRFQTIVFLCMTYVYMSMVAFHLMVIVFVCGEPNWECVENSTICNLTEAVSTVSEYYNRRCDMPRSEWKFVDTYTSTVTEYDLVCEDSILQSVVSSLFWAGWLVGNVVLGYISDKLGRQKANQLSVSLVFLSSWALIWPKKLWIFMFCRFITGFGSGGACMCAFIVIMEFSPSKQRGKVGTAMFFSGPVAYSLIALFAFLNRDWRCLMLFGATLGFPVMAFIWFVPETPRYLLVHGRLEEARAILKLIARWNKKQMPQEEIHVSQQATGEKGNFRDIFYNKTVSLLTITTWFLWLTVALTYYAVSYNAVYLGGNIYLSFFLNNIILFPANYLAIVAMKKIGRKNSVIFGLLIASVSNLITASIPGDRTDTGFTAGRITASMIAKGSISVSLCGIYLLGAEVFPTTVRNIAMGTASACGRIGSFVALYIIWLQRIHRYVPHVILGTMCLICGITCYILIPETKKATTPEVFMSKSKENLEMNNGHEHKLLDDC
ncbi:solute carrier family 22 member 16-like isoform X2 [Dendronephthya gigantea]|uniref:solute carrier family 22 member 16-like isoform X2 n=1 Tax=Dendronephthya gigantea TaxID=151771 RepID=UPI00106B178F|nr:solute carrier family 22 member 16-like isoform X2 [Dendronephthya gigantea]